MGAEANQGIIPFGFPYHLGPGTRDLAAVLLFRGRLALDLPGWVSPNVLNAFNAAFSTALKNQHHLLPLFRTASHYFDLSQSHAQGMLETINPVRTHVSLVMTAYPGDSTAYSNWQPLHATCLPIAQAALSEPLHCCVASLELVWRLHECALEKGMDPDALNSVDGGNLLEALSARADHLGGPKPLLAECALNRYCMPRSGSGAYATSSEFAVAMLAAIGRFLPVTDRETSTPRREALAFHIFEHLVPADIRKFTPMSTSKIASLLTERDAELNSMRSKCHELASELLFSSPTEAQLPELIYRRLDGLKEEVSQIAQLDSRSLKQLFKQLAEDPKAWAVIGSVAGSAFGLPDFLTAAMAVTALSTLGAQAVKAANDHRETLRKSPWSFVYYASR